jgi:hypothetical protein
MIHELDHPKWFGAEMGVVPSAVGQSRPLACETLARSTSAHNVVMNIMDVGPDVREHDQLVCDVDPPESFSAEFGTISQVVGTCTGQTRVLPECITAVVRPVEGLGELMTAIDAGIGASALASALAGLRRA